MKLRPLMLGTTAVLAVLTPLAFVPEAQAQILRARRCARVLTPCEQVVVAAPVVTHVVAPVVVTPPQQVIVQAPTPFVDVQVRNRLVHVQTPTVNVQVGLPPLTAARFTVYYRDNGGWQPYGSYALRVRAQNAANALTANKGWETMVR